MLPIMTGRHIFGCTLDARMADVRQRVKAQWGMDLASPAQVSATAALMARVNHNRWIIECPDCHSAEYLWPDEPLFMCTNCFNGTVGGRWRRIRVPVTRDTIERILRARPVPQNRNWEPGETVEALRTENRVRGLPEGVD